MRRCAFEEAARPHGVAGGLGSTAGPIVAARLGQRRLRAVAVVLEMVGGDRGAAEVLERHPSGEEFEVGEFVALAIAPRVERPPEREGAVVGGDSVGELILLV